jgi:hypothetical protein
MYARLLAAAAAASLGAGPVSAAVLLLQTSSGFSCGGDSCSGVEDAGGGRLPFTIDTFSVNRHLLGALGASLVHITFWSADGKTLLGDFGNFDLSVLGGDQLNLKGNAVTFAPGVGDLSFKIEKLDLSGHGGVGGGGGGGGLGGGGDSSSDEPRGFSPVNFPNDQHGQGDGPGKFGSFASGGPSAFSFAAPLADSVPEPGAWALMMLGFGGLGAMARAQRETRSAVRGDRGAQPG